jgi:predicted RNase H-like HicB family nuclease
MLLCDTSLPNEGQKSCSTEMRPHSPQQDRLIGLFDGPSDLAVHAEDILQQATTKFSRWSKALQLTALIEREDDGYVATCLELDVVSQGDTIEQARMNLLEAVEGFFEVASLSEIKRRQAY